MSSVGVGVFVMIVFALKHHVQCCNHKCDQKRAVHHSDIADCDRTEYYDHRGFTRACV